MKRNKIGHLPSEFDISDCRIIVNFQKKIKKKENGLKNRFFFWKFFQKKGGIKISKLIQKIVRKSIISKSIVSTKPKTIFFCQDSMG